MHCRYYLYGIGSYDSRIPLCFYEQMRRRGGSRMAVYGVRYVRESRPQIETTGFDLLAAPKHWLWCSRIPL